MERLGSLEEKMDNLTRVTMEIKEDLKNLMETRNINEFLMVSVFES
jgi:hypothetical protein